ncbi:MAG TPA: zf-HC2 domain-containing protein [Pyrinomonadaceae bacterium]|nr:zf-HC2 domain-containing protein [Pyrinomonadaceae bacterium]
MNERQNSPNCERGSDLIAFLYGEAAEREVRDFQLHLQQCVSCREEVASFGVVRESITAWRDEALAGFVSTPVAAQPKTKSALAALRQFFDLSPLWLKGATAALVVTFCVLFELALFKSNNNQVTSNVNPGAVYSEQDVNRIVKEALAQQQASAKPPQIEPEPRQTDTVRPVKIKPKSSRVSSSTQFAKGQRPLSKAEREQLAAELRLLSGSDDASLHLLGDRINQ